MGVDVTGADLVELRPRIFNLRDLRKDIAKHGLCLALRRMAGNLLLWLRYYHPLGLHSGIPLRGDGLKLLSMDAADLKFPSQSFDLTFSFAAIEHFLDLCKVAREIERVLKAGGICHLSIHLWRRFKYSGRISKKCASAAATEFKMSSETVSCGFQRKMRVKRRHCFLVPYSSGGGNKWLKVGRDLGGRKLIEPGLVTGVLELPFLDGHIDGKADDAIQRIVIDQRNGALLAGKVVVMKLVVFGVEEMNFSIGAMESSDLFLERDEGISFLGVAGNGDAADGKFDSQMRFDGCGNDGVVAEDLFGLVRVGGHAADADAGVSIVREFGTAETGRIGCFSKKGRNQDFMNVGFSKSENQTKFGQRLLDAKEFGCGSFRTGQLSRRCKGLARFCSASNGVYSRLIPSPTP